jgi:hypothetical protein
VVKRISVLLRRGAEQLGQLGHLDGDTPGLVAREQIGSVRRPGSVSGVRQWLPVVVSDNEAGAVVFDVPRRRGGHQLRSFFGFPSGGWGICVLDLEPTCRFGQPGMENRVASQRSKQARLRMTGPSR